MTDLPTPLQTGRFLRLAKRSAEVWQCAFRRLPMWIDNPTDAELPPTRAFGFVCRSVRTGLVHLGMPKSRDEAALADCAVNTLQEFGLKWQKQVDGRPAAIHVEDRALKDALDARRTDLDADVVLVPNLPDLTTVLRHMQETASGDDRPNLLDDPTITVEMVRAFAEAAAAFHRAAPWRLLDNADLIIVEHGGVPRSVSHLSVLGAGGEEFGVSFYETQAQFERMMHGRMPARLFGVTFGPLDALPFGDVDLWEDAELPVNREDAYPLAAEIQGRGMRRPTADELVAIEALLTALAQVTEDELDSGTWTANVSTFRGALQLTLTLPEVVTALDPGAAGSSRLAGHEALSPPEEARQWAGRALEWIGRPRTALARRALSLDPDCADAWTALIDSAPDADEAIVMARKAVDASRRTLGDAVFTEAAGSFWMVYETRPYMRAMAELARALQLADQMDAAIETWQEMLRLNPNDNQGMRYVLLYALLGMRRHEDLGKLIAQYEDDVEASWRFGHALWIFSRDGETPEAAAQLQRAHDVNRHVLPLVLGRLGMPLQLPEHYQLGSKDEAAYAASVLIPAVARVDGALDWLEVQAMSLLKTAKRKPLSRPAQKRKPDRDRKR